MTAAALPGFFQRLLQLLTGLVLFGIGIALMLRAEIGLAPWDVLTQGIERQTGWPFGVITVLISLLVLLLWLPLRQRPGWGSVLNAILIGPAVQLGLMMLPQTQLLHWQVLMFASGLVMIAVATGMYIGAHMGTGPRDGLMIGLHTCTGYAIWKVRTALEVTVLVVGVALGGTIGWGTLAFALLIGPLCGFTMPLLDSRGPHFSALPAARHDPNSDTKKPNT